jgi:hypothetical protein
MRHTGTASGAAAVNGVASAGGFSIDIDAGRGLGLDETSCARTSEDRNS